MNRPVFALFANRSDAEAARARLARDVNVGSTRMLAKDTAAAVGALRLDPRLKDHYREALQGGDHLLIANVARGEDAKRIVEALASTAARASSVTVSAPHAVTSRVSSSSACSTMGDRPRRTRSSFWGSTSTPITRCPRCAKHTAETLPT